MNYKLRTKKAFTLIELIVAVAILAIIVTFSSMIFNVSIDANRTANANAEVMQKLRAITSQLSRDFAGLQKDAPVFIYFDNADPNRYDQILFFANGDFQSIQLYNNSGEPDETNGDDVVVGNVARVYYGQAYSSGKGPSGLPEEYRMLARRQHILTADTSLVDFPNTLPFTFTAANNDKYEHDRRSLAEWKTVDAATWQNIIAECFEDTINPAENRPWVNMRDPNDYHKLMCEGVSRFAIQWAYWDSTDNKYYWFPSKDLDGTGTLSDFVLMGDQFGVYFNVPNWVNFGSWKAMESGAVSSATEVTFSSEFFPDAFKFTFTIYDSKGVLKEGRTFTHIFYVGD